MEPGYVFCRARLLSLSASGFSIFTIPVRLPAQIETEDTDKKTFKSGNSNNWECSVKNFKYDEEQIYAAGFCK